MTTYRMNRRSVLRTAGGLAVAGGLAAASLSRGTASAAPSAWTHPGMLHNAGDINRAKVRVAAGTDPWLSGWNKLTANSHSQSTWTNRATATVIRGGTGENYSLLFNDIAAAYQNALRWQV